MYSYGGHQGYKLEDLPPTDYLASRCAESWRYPFSHPSSNYLPLYLGSFLCIHGPPFIMSRGHHIGQPTSGLTRHAWYGTWRRHPVGPRLRGAWLGEVSPSRTTCLHGHDAASRRIDTAPSMVMAQACQRASAKLRTSHDTALPGSTKRVMDVDFVPWPRNAGFPRCH